MADSEMTALPTSEERARLVKCSGTALQFLYVDVLSDVLVDTSQAGQGHGLHHGNLFN